MKNEQPKPGGLSSYPPVTLGGRTFEACNAGVYMGTQGKSQLYFQMALPIDHESTNSMVDLKESGTLPHAPGKSWVYVSKTVLWRDGLQWLSGLLRDDVNAFQSALKDLNQLTMLESENDSDEEHDEEADERSRHNSSGTAAENSMSDAEDTAAAHEDAASHEGDTPNEGSINPTPRSLSASGKHHSTVTAGYNEGMGGSFAYQVPTTPPSAAKDESGDAGLKMVLQDAPIAGIAAQPKSVVVEVPEFRAVNRKLYLAYHKKEKMWFLLDSHPKEVAQHHEEHLQAQAESKGQHARASDETADGDADADGNNNSSGMDAPASNNDEDEDHGADHEEDDEDAGTAVDVDGNQESDADHDGDGQNDDAAQSRTSEKLSHDIETAGERKAQEDDDDEDEGEEEEGVVVTEMDVDALFHMQNAYDERHLITVDAVILAALFSPENALRVCLLQKRASLRGIEAWMKRDFSCALPLLQRVLDETAAIQEAAIRVVEPLLPRVFDYNIFFSALGRPKSVQDQPLLRAKTLKDIVDGENLSGGDSAGNAEGADGTAAELQQNVEDNEGEGTEPSQEESAADMGSTDNPHAELDHTVMGSDDGDGGRESSVETVVVEPSTFWEQMAQNEYFFTFLEDIQRKRNRVQQQWIKKKNKMLRRGIPFEGNEIDTWSTQTQLSAQEEELMQLFFVTHPNIRVGPCVCGNETSTTLLKSTDPPPPLSEYVRQTTQVSPIAEDELERIIATLVGLKIFPRRRIHTRAYLRSPGAVRLFTYMVLHLPLTILLPRWVMWFEEEHKSFRSFLPSRDGTENNDIDVGEEEDDDARESSGEADGAANDGNSQGKKDHPHIYHLYSDEDSDEDEENKTSVAKQRRRREKMWLMPNNKSEQILRMAIIDGIVNELAEEEDEKESELLTEAANDDWFVAYTNVSIAETARTAALTVLANSENADTEIEEDEGSEGEDDEDEQDEFNNKEEGEDENGSGDDEDVDGNENGEGEDHAAVHEGGAPGKKWDFRLDDFFLRDINSVEHPVLPPRSALKPTRKERREREKKLAWIRKQRMRLSPLLSPLVGKVVVDVRRRIARLRRLLSLCDKFEASGQSIGDGAAPDSDAVVEELRKIPRLRPIEETLEASQKWSMSSSMPMMDLFLPPVLGDCAALVARALPPQSSKEKRVTLIDPVMCSTFSTPAACAGGDSAVKQNGLLYHSDIALAVIALADDLTIQQTHAEHSARLQAWTAMRGTGSVAVRAARRVRQENTQALCELASAILERRGYPAAPAASECAMQWDSQTHAGGPASKPTRSLFLNVRERLKSRLPDRTLEEKRLLRGKKMLALGAGSTEAPESALALLMNVLPATAHVPSLTARLVDHCPLFSLFSETLWRALPTPPSEQQTNHESSGKRIQSLRDPRSWWAQLQLHSAGTTPAFQLIDLHALLTSWITFTKSNASESDLKERAQSVQAAVNSVLDTFWIELAYYGFLASSATHTGAASPESSIGGLSSTSTIASISLHDCETALRALSLPQQLHEGIMTRVQVYQELLRSIQKDAVPLPLFAEMDGCDDDDDDDDDGFSGTQGVRRFSRGVVDQRKSLLLPTHHPITARRSLFRADAVRNVQQESNVRRKQRATIVAKQYNSAGGETPSRMNILVAGGSSYGPATSRAAASPPIVTSLAAVLNPKDWREDCDILFASTEASKEKHHSAVTKLLESTSLAPRSIISQETLYALLVELPRQQNSIRPAGQQNESCRHTPMYALPTVRLLMENGGIVLMRPHPFSTSVRPIDFTIGALQLQLWEGKHDTAHLSSTQGNAQQQHAELIAMLVVEIASGVSLDVPLAQGDTTVLSWLETKLPTSDAGPILALWRRQVAVRQSDPLLLHGIKHPLATV